jgi:hypothetical protein
MNTPDALLDRLDAIGRSLATHDDALALFGLGSVGQELDRLDEYSDLDFFVVVRPGAKQRFFDNIDWLEAAAPVVFRYRGPGDGLHVLFTDGIYAEMAIFTVAELGTALYTPGRIVWKRAGVDEALAEPARTPPTPTTPPLDQLLGEILCNLHVGLLRFRRGERLAAAREIQLYAVDRMLELAAHLEPEQAAARDPFARMRRFERRFPQMAAHLGDFQQGYDRTPESAAAMLDFLSARFPLNEAMVAEIRALL